MLILLFGLFSFGWGAQHHPKVFSGISCQPLVDIMPDRLRMTSSRDNVAENSCSWPTNLLTLPNTLYFKIDRTYAQHSHEDSLLSVSLQNQLNKQLVRVEIHNDKISIGDEHCSGIFAHLRSQPFWIRLQIDAFVDLGMTYISVAYAPFRNIRFRKCIQTKRQQDWTQTYLSFQASSHSGMNQDILQFTLDAPFDEANRSHNPLQEWKTRFEIIEHRLEVLEQRTSANHQYQHQNHQVVTDRHDTLQKTLHTQRTQLNHNDAKSTTRFIFLIAFVGVVTILFGWYAKICFHRIISINKDHVI